MTSKASNQRDITDVIKKQKREAKKLAGIARAQASGISGSDTTIASGPKTQAGGAGASNVTQDLLMNTFDIRDVDRLYFSTTAGSADVLTANDTGIESKSYYNGTSYVSYGINHQVPAGNIHTFFIGSDEKFNIGTNNSSLLTNLGLLGYLDIGANYIQVDDTTPTLVGTVPANERRIFSDSTNNSELSVKKSDGSVVSLEGGGGSGGAGLGDNNTWTGTNTFTNTVTVEDASFGIRDQSDNTKVANFQCSGISSGTTRTYTLPNASTSLAGLGVTSQTWTGTNGFAGITNINGTATFDTLATYSGTVPVKLQGDGNNTTQTVAEIGKYGDHGVKFIAEILGDTGRSMSNPDGGSDIPVPGTNEPALSIKAAMIMNTYTMYDLDTLVFSQSSSSTTPAPANDWVYIEANTGTSGTPNLTGMTYNVPTGKTHQFKVNGSLKVSIDDDIDFSVGSTLEISNTIASPTSLAVGSAMAPPTNPTAYFKVHYNGADRYIPYYT